MNQESTLASRVPGTGIGVQRFDVFDVSVGLPLAVCAAFVWTAQTSPLPATGWATAFLLLAVESDVRTLRIPNWLTFSGLALALALAAFTGGIPAFGHALVGAGAALAALFVPFVLRWIGAGDVKAVMVLGALWGGTLVIPVIFWMFAAGGVISIALLVARGELGDMLRRWGRSLWITLSTLRVTYFAPPPESTAGSGLPFAVAVGIGASAFQLWGLPWA